MALTKVICNETTLFFCDESLHFCVESKDSKWGWVENYRPRLCTDEGEFYFSDAKSIIHSKWKTGVGEGIRSTFTGFSDSNGKEYPLAFETVAWIEAVSGDVFFEFIPLEEDGIHLQAIYWPGPMEFSEDSQKWYSVLNVLQGLITPNNWENEISNEINKINFKGQFCSTAAYMPWWGQVRPGSGYMAICTTPWDAAYEVDHPAKGPFTHVSMRWLESMGGITYRRTMQYKFFGECNYNDLCKSYRLYANEQGLLVTLNEKAAKCPNVDNLIGSAVVHKGIKTHYAYRSGSYGRENTISEDYVTPFKTRTEQMKKLKAAGLEKVYLHLDGWGDPGYDNKHPDYLPACVEAGGWEGMKELSDTMKECGYMFGIHDQYRDYYFDAPTFDENFAARKADGTIQDQTIWAGGRQSFLCTTQAPYYVKRNFEELFRHGIHLEATYLDVFTCNEGDECTHPWHKMTRKECFEYRRRCFDYLLSKNILSSSEEVVDWAIPSLVFAHYGPYDFMLCKPDAPRKGVPTPLFNLVYHDCVILPWLMDCNEREGDYMLYAVLNGGAAYLDCETEGDAFQREIDRYKVVSKLQEKVAKCEMVCHEFLDDSFRRERTTYSNGTVVTIDHDKQSYEIE